MYMYNSKLNALYARNYCNRQDRGVFPVHINFLAFEVTDAALMKET